jgi:serine/threonine protein kinase
MVNRSPCPESQSYARLLSGQLSEEQRDALLAHLETCEPCGTLADRQLAMDTMVSLMRQAQAVPAPSRAVVGLIDRLSQLRPDAPVPSGAELPEEPLTQLPAEADEASPEEPYAFLAPAQAAEELGRLGPYRVLQVLGAGGMGVVFRAHDPQLDRMVALKAMLPALASRDSARQRFLREARAAAALKHDHIVTIYQVGEDRGVPFLAMEFLEGESLEARWQREGKFPVTEVLRIGREMALGLAAAHARGLIHRDIKPANVWLEGERGRVKILDFGLARAVGEERQLTREGAIIGTPAFMAPEQGRGERVDARSDLFSLGCVLYLMATGVPAFRGTDLISTLMAVATENPRPPRELEPGLPQQLSDLILRLLAKEPGQRPPSAQAVAEDLVRIAAPRGLPAVPRKRKKWPIAVGLAVCPLVVGLAILWTAGAFKVQAEEGTIVFEDLPVDAEILVDGEAAQVHSDPEGQGIRVDAAAGERKLLIKAAGFESTRRFVTFRAGERQTIRIHLEPSRVAGQPPGEVPGPGHPVPRTATVLRGRWELTDDGLLQQDTARAFPVLLFGDPAWRDYDFSVEAMRLEGNDQFALFFRVTDSGSLYWFGAAEWGNTLLQLGAKWQRRDDVLRKYRLRLKNNQWYTARVQARGTHLTCSLSEGGRLLHAFEIDDDRHPAGRVGLRTCCSAVRFRNIKVTAPDGAVLWEGPPHLPGQPPWAGSR